MAGRSYEGSEFLNKFPEEILPGIYMSIVLLLFYKSDRFAQIPLDKLSIIHTIGIQISELHELTRINIIPLFDYPAGRIYHFHRNHFL